MSAILPVCFARSWRNAGAWIAATTAWALIAALAPSASAQTLVVVTVDVESNSSYTLPAQLDAVCENGSKCGLSEIVRMLKARKLAGTFFLNVYEHTRWGEPAMRNIAVGLERDGQDVALHTHPDAYDPARPEMYQYDLGEQTSIVRDGVRLLSAWTGRPVVAHRAGAYSANAETLEALQANEVLLDSSMFWSQPKSHLDRLNRPRNLPWTHGKLTEIPVTVYQRDDRPAWLGSMVDPVSVIRKIDVDWLIDAQEARDAIDEVVAAKIPVLVVFLHSFSFLADSGSEQRLQVDQQSLDLFDVILDHVAAKRLPVATMRQIAEHGFGPQPSAATDVVPRVAVAVDVPHYLWRRAKGTNRMSLGLMSIGTTLLIAGVVFVAVKRGRSR